MADKIQNAHSKETDGITDASVLKAILYLDSSTNFREHLAKTPQPVSPQKGDFITQDEGLSPVWGRWLNLGLIAFLVCMILLLAQRA